MATTNTTAYDAFPARGVYPSDAGGRMYQSYVSDEEGLDNLNDIVNQIPLAVGTIVIDAGMELGDHDSATSVTHSLVLHDGTTAHEIIKDATTGRAGGVVRVGGGTSADPVPGDALTAQGRLYVETTAAPGGAQTSGRLVRVWAYVQAKT